ncbi:MAG: hypothetical protein JO057_07045 [Chloroflexi bacterium]|nr:hypothetical protein [Chloroflexota bacterium]
MRLTSLAIILLSLGVACAQLTPPPLGQVQALPPALSPELRDQRNRLDVHYHLNAPATVSSRIVSSDGQQWTIASDAARPTSGDYVLQFDGTVAGPGPNERRVLPDGDYQLILDVQGSTQSQQAPVPLAIRGADTTLPTLDDLTLLPDQISPDFDAQNDVTHLTYSLGKDALVAPFLDSVSASGTLQRVWMGEEVKTTAGSQIFTWDGTTNGQPVADGQYMLGVRARDTAGNIVENSQPLVIEDSGVPEATIVSAQISPTHIIRGDQVCLDATVRNTGQTVLRTQGPDPGYVYDSLDNFSSIENHAYAEHAGFWRIGLNWSGSTDLSGATYPYRWGFGHDLQPGDQASVHGCVRVQNEQDQVIFAAALVQENVAIHNAGAGLVRVQIS